MNPPLAPTANAIEASPSSHSGSDLWGSPLPPATTIELEPPAPPSLHLPSRTSRPSSNPPSNYIADPLLDDVSMSHHHPLQHTPSFDWTATEPQWGADAVTDDDFDFFNSASTAAPLADLTASFSFDASPMATNDFGLAESTTMHEPFVFSPMDTSTSPAFLLPLDPLPNHAGGAPSTSPFPALDHHLSPSGPMDIETSPQFRHSTSPIFIGPASTDPSPHIILDQTPHPSLLDPSSGIDYSPPSRSLDSLSLIDVPPGYEALEFDEQLAETQRENYRTGKFSRVQLPKSQSFSLPSSSGDNWKRLKASAPAGESSSIKRFHRPLPRFHPPAASSSLPSLNRLHLLQDAYALLSDPKVSVILRLKRSHRKSTRTAVQPPRSSAFSPRTPPLEDDLDIISPSHSHSDLPVSKPKNPSISLDGEAQSFLAAAIETAFHQLSLPLEPLSYRPAHLSSKHVPSTPLGPLYPTTPISPFAHEQQVCNELQTVGRFLAGEMMVNPVLRQRLLETVCHTEPLNSESFAML